MLKGADKEDHGHKRNEKDCCCANCAAAKEKRL
jgi:hypothetical protein